MAAKDNVIVNYGHEEQEFYLNQVARSVPFEHNNHYHSTYEIYYLLSGRRYYFIKDQTYPVSAGDLVLINKYDVHHTSGFGPPQHERIVMNFSDSFLGTEHPLFRPELLEVFLRDHHIYRLKPQEQWLVEELFRNMTEEVKQQPAGFELSVRLLVSQLLLFIYRLQDSAAVVTEDPLSPTHRRIDEIVQYINMNYHEKLPLPELAKRFAMSPSYLSRTFKHVTGFTLVGYQNLTRIREAQSLLVQTDERVIDIAEKVGFEQFAHFNRMFKRITGTNPTRYRRQNRI